MDDNEKGYFIDNKYDNRHIQKLHMGDKVDMTKKSKQRSKNEKKSG
jgi:hypothetical protein